MVSSIRMVISAMAEMPEYARVGVVGGGLEAGRGRRRQRQQYCEDDKVSSFL
jgi:hypothetical protein